MRRAAPTIALIGLLALPGPVAAQTEPGIRAENPHGYGWWLGDVLVQRIRVGLPQGVAIDPASLPKPRAVDYWLDLREVTSREIPGGIELTLRWQNFYSALEPQAREVPGAPIRLTDGTEAHLPGFRFVTSPIRPLAAPSTPDQLLPDPVYHLIDLNPNRIGLAASGLAALASFLALAWHQAWGPFRRRADRPFTRAARLIARLPGADATGRRRQLHRAFDAAFGRVLIGAELPQFLRARPEFQPVAERLGTFFAQSDAAFFGRAQDLPDGDVAPLARDLARIERGRR